MSLDPGPDANQRPSQLLGSLAAIALGGNVGDSQAIFTDALDILGQVPGIDFLRRSRWYETVAVGPPQANYLNACALLRVQGTPMELLQILLAVEQQLGRVRRERWGPRTLDLDLLLFEQLILETSALEIPHPRLKERAFVLIPLAEIAPTWVEPRSGKAIATLAEGSDPMGVWCCEGTEATNHSSVA